MATSIDIEVAAPFEVRDAGDRFMLALSTTGAGPRNGP